MWLSVACWNFCALAHSLAYDICVPGVVHRVVVCACVCARECDATWAEDVFM